MMYPEWQSCIIWSSRRICFRTDGFASMRTIWGIRTRPVRRWAERWHGVGKLRRATPACGKTHLLRHDGAGGYVLDLFNAAAVSLPELLEVLEVLVAQIILRLCIHVETRKLVGERRMVGHAMCGCDTRRGCGGWTGCR